MVSSLHIPDPVFPQKVLVLGNFGVLQCFDTVVWVTEREPGL